MEDEEARKGQCAHFRAAPQQALEWAPNDRNIGQDVRAHGRCEISLLIPGQQVAGEGHPQHQSKQHASGEPEQFSPSLVRSVQKRLTDVQK